MARFDGSLRRLALPALGLVELAGWMGRVGWEGGWVDALMSYVARVTDMLEVNKWGLAVNLAWFARKGKRRRVDKL